MPGFGRKKAVERQVALIAPFVDRGEAVLDIMCQSGEVADLLAARTGCKAWGADLWPSLRCNLPYAPMQRQEYTGFAEQAFDLALLRGVLHHLPYDLQPALLCESLRVARRVLLLEPATGIAARLEDMAENILQLGRKPLPMAHRSFEQWRQLAAEAGRILREERIGRKAAGPGAGWLLLHVQSRDLAEAT